MLPSAQDTNSPALHQLLKVLRPHDMRPVILRVRIAFEQGAHTASEVSRLTGLSIGECSSGARRLCHLGLLEWTGRTVKEEKGRSAHYYEWNANAAPRG